MIALLAAALLTTPLARGDAIGTPPSRQDAATFPAPWLRWINAALPVLKEKKFDLEKYDVTLHEEEETVTLILTEAGLARKEGSRVRGNPGKIPGLEIQVRKSDAKVLSSHYIK